LYLQGYVYPVVKEVVFIQLLKLYEYSFNNWILVILDHSLVSV